MYLVFVTASAVILTAAFLFSTPSLDRTAISNSAFVAVAAALAYRFPVSFGFKRRIYLDVVAIASAIMILDPGPAAFAIGVGAMAGQLLRDRVWDEASFNTAQAVLQTVAGGMLFDVLDWKLSDLFNASPAAIGGLIALIGVMYAINSLLLAGIIGLQSGISPTKVLIESGTSIIELASQAAQVAAAVIAALLVTTNVLLGVLLLAPCAVLYLILRRNVQQQKFAIIGMLETLADLVDYRDPYTATHARRVADIASAITTEMDLPTEQVDLIRTAARFHNLGSLTITAQPGESVGGLHSDSWNMMRQVPAMSADLLYQFPETTLAGNLVKHHLERYDGEGYPDGLSGRDIPIGSRIIAVADAIDAMLQHRPYRPALTPAELRSELERYRGTQWDPEIVNVVLRMVDRGALAFAVTSDGSEDRLLAEGPASAHTIEQQIQHQAFHDPLTDLPNRLLLMNRLSRGLTGDGPRFAVLFIDLDGFKQVNDALGHRVGDHVLVEASARIRGEVATNDLVARLGGDEFVVLMWNNQSAKSAQYTADCIIRALNGPLKTVETRLTLAASVGIAIARPGVDEPDDVLHRADSAMYEAKRTGRGRTMVAAGDAEESDIGHQAAG